MIQPMKAALYFDDIEGFGEWPILLSTRAQKDLRGVKRADGAMFQIVVKKIKWDLTLHRNNLAAANPSQATVSGTLFS